MNALQEKVQILERDSRLLSERNKQIHSLDRELAIKEDLIHKLLAEKEQAEMLAGQVKLASYIVSGNLRCITIFL